MKWINDSYWFEVKFDLSQTYYTDLTKKTLSSPFHQFHHVIWYFIKRNYIFTMQIIISSSISSVFLAGDSTWQRENCQKVCYFCAIAFGIIYFSFSYKSNFWQWEKPDFSDHQRKGKIGRSNYNVQLRGRKQLLIRVIRNLKIEGSIKESWFYCSAVQDGSQIPSVSQLEFYCFVKV